ncbi:MAG: PrgI family protein [Acetivibrio sp.]
MKIEVNKDFNIYKVEQWKGLERKQILYCMVLVGVLVPLLGIMVFVCRVPILLSIWLLSPPLVVVLLFGFYQVDNMGFLEWLKRTYQLRYQEPLLFATIEELESQQTESKTGDFIGSNKKKKKQKEQKQRKKEKKQGVTKS